MPLSDVKIRSAKPGEKTIKMSDGAGLQLWISPAGNKVWNLAYSFLGKQKKLSIGPYPAVGLAEARERAREAKKLLANGIDPSAEKQREKALQKISNALTFDAIADELLDKKRREGRAKTTLGKLDWILGFARERLGTRPIREITAAEVLVALKDVEMRGRLESARRLRSVIGEVFRYAIATARADNDPTFALRGALVAPTVKHRSAIINPAELGALLRAIEHFDGQPTTVAALKLMALLFPRPGELRLSEWTEFNLSEEIWTIPAARTKMRREHKVPLPRQAIAILTALSAITGRGKLVFPGYGMGSRAGRPVIPRPISENTLNGALRRMGYSPDEMTAHGFRATASTLLNESNKWNADAIERALAHVESDDVRRAYARGAHWLERVQMMQWWADHLDALRDGAKIIPISGRTA